MNIIGPMANTASRPYLTHAFETRNVSVSHGLNWPLTIITGMLCGALAVLAFQEGTLQILHLYQGQNPFLVKLFGYSPAPFQLQASVVGLPHLATEVLWGAVMGVPLAAYLCRGQPVPMLAAGAIYGAGAVGGLLLVALPSIRGLPIGGHASREVISLTLLLCAAWGWGTALFLKLVTRR